jgi:hypothetical protein
MSTRFFKKFNMDKTYSARTPMIVRALESDTDPFKPKEEMEDVLGQEYPHLSDIDALMYLTNNTRPDICFCSELSCKTQRNSYNASLKRH